MKVAIVHYWLVGMRGGEKVLEALCELYPNADIFTHVLDPETLSDTLRKHTIKTSFINRLPAARRHYKTYLPLMPLALEHLDLRGYDLVISSESGPSKGIIPQPESLHVCYCHSPMRYIWNMYSEYRQSAGLLTRLAMPFFSHYLRMWDVSTSTRVDNFIANSDIVAKRIEKYYRRDADIIHPPVSIDDFAPVQANELGDYYLMVGELVRYKRPDLAVEAFNRTGRKLVIIGGGEMLKELDNIAGPTVEVLGPQPFDQLQHHYARCKALIFPGQEDFGIVPVEAMASGRPVIAYGSGGALDTVIDGLSGLLFFEQTINSLNEAVERFEASAFDTDAIRAHAEGFSKARFKAEMKALIDRELEAHKRPARPKPSILLTDQQYTDGKDNGDETTIEHRKHRNLVPT